MPYRPSRTGVHRKKHTRPLRQLERNDHLLTADQDTLWIWIRSKWWMIFAIAFIVAWYVLQVYGDIPLDFWRQIKEMQGW